VLLAVAFCLPAGSYVVVAADAMHDPFGFASIPALPADAASATAACKPSRFNSWHMVDEILIMMAAGGHNWRGYGCSVFFGTPSSL